MKKFLNTAPELYFISAGVFWTAEGFFSSGSINYIALLVTWLLFLQVLYKNRVAGIIYGLALTLGSAWMFTAVLCEFYQMASSSKAMQLIVAGTGLFGLGTFMGLAMVYKYITAKVNYDESVLTVTY